MVKSYTCGYNRKYAIRLLRKKLLPAPNRKLGPVPIYAKEQLLLPLKRIWFATDQMCSKKLKAVIPLRLTFYEMRQKARNTLYRK